MVVFCIGSAVMQIYFLLCPRKVLKQANLHRNIFSIKNAKMGFTYSIAI